MASYPYLRPLLLTFGLNLAAASNAGAAVDNGERIDAARRAYDDGVALSKQGEMESALASFERAYDIGRHPAVLFNIGQLQFSLGQLVKAKETLDRFMRGVGSTDDIGRIRQAERTLQYLRRRIGTIRVSAEPPDASVFLDGALVDQTTHSADTLVGPHSVVASHNRFQTEARLIEVEPGKSAVVELKLTPVPTQMGWMKLSCAVPDVTIRLGNKFVSRDAQTQPVAVPVGTHVLRFARPGYLSRQRTVSVELGKLSNIGCGIEPAQDLTGVDKGRLAIRAVPKAAEIIVDGSVLTQSFLPAGLHRVEVRHPGYQSWSKEVRISNQSDLAFDVVLVPTAATTASIDAESRRKRLVAYSAGAAGLSLDAGAFVAYLLNSKRHESWEHDRNEVAAGRASTAEWASLAQRAASIQRVDDFALAGAVVGTVLLATSVYYLVGDGGVTSASGRPRIQSSRLSGRWQW